jgi:multiple sugar transport system ATP-binding protein
MQPAVSVKDLKIAYGDHTVIEKLSMDIAPREFLVLLGPSGCGKSTLLNAIAGLQDITDGEMWISGKNVTWDEPKDRGIGMVFQSYALYPRMTVRKNLSFGLRVAGLAKAEIDARIARTASLLHLDTLLERRPSELSGGQRQRVAIGRALVREVDVFLFDEPLSNLDAKLRNELRVEIKKLHQSLGNTMIYVTHDQVEAMTLADRIVILNDCRIEQMGRPDEVYARPASRFVATFVGSPAMNILPVTVSGSGDRLKARLTDGSLVELPGAPVNMDWRELGVRPESLTVVSEGSETSATATVVERLGERTLVYARLADGTQVTAQDRGLSSVKPGDAVRLKFDTAALHLFAADGSTWHAR